MARITITDVAQASGVSPATVSFVLNDTPGQTIPATTRERIQQAAKDLGYVPHGIARALREGSSRIVVLNVRSTQEGHYSHSYIRGLDEELAAHDHVLLVRHVHGEPRSTKQVLDAIAPRATLDFGVPYRSGHELEDAGGGWSDGLAAHAAMQISYLADRGHRQIALGLPTPKAPLAEIRMRFSNQTAERLGIELLCAFVAPRDREAVARETAAFRLAHPEVTAVAAYDDDVALRVLAGMHDNDLTAPDDLAVMGFDSTEYGALTTPSLTTVHIDAEAHGRRAARKALGLESDDVPLTPGHVIVRQSA